MNQKKTKLLRKTIPNWREARYQSESALNWRTLELDPDCGKYAYRMAKRRSA